VAVDAVRAPAIPGVTWARVAHEPFRLDYGPRWPDGIVTLEPPRRGRPFATRVPQVDEDGNERGGVPALELLAPLATYMPWRLRGGAHPHELAEFYGTLVPFARDRAERERRGDPRPSVAERYRDRAAYVARVRHGAETLVRAGFLLGEDVAHAVGEAERRWERVTRAGPR